MFAFAPVSAFTGVSLRPAQATCSARPSVGALKMMSDDGGVHEGPGKGFGTLNSPRDISQVSMTN
jgi:hypothetical protein